ncbi:MAG: flavodoxin [Lachnospiraceae bacterium]|nr:flavodoxin [Lachnospiraceae bacterium]
MDMIYVVYWSQTGNTQAMAEAVGKGIMDAGKEAKVVSVSEVSVDELKEVKGFAMGCPAMGAENLEESEMEPFVCEVEAFVKGKTVALFGSYGWGNGEWMEDWTQRMEDAGANVINGNGVICQETPEADTLAECEALGRQLAAL